MMLDKMEKAQVEFYTDKIMRNPEWRFAGIFAEM